MGASDEAREQVVERSHSLGCAVCGAGNRLTSEARTHGWFRCAHCGAGAPVPGVGDFVVEGPKGEAWRVVRSGSSEIETDIGYVFDLVELLVLVAVADLFGSGMIEAMRIWAAPDFVDRLWIVLVAFVLLVAGVGVLGFLTRQRLVVREDEMSLSLVTLGKEWRRRHLDTTRFRTSLRGGGRPGVELQVPGRTLVVSVESNEAAKWLEGEIGAAVHDARLPSSDDRLSCPGCGGPVGLEREVLTQQGLDCEHCGTGLLVTRGGIRLPPARLNDRLQGHPDYPADAPERQGDLLCWSIPSWASGHPRRLPLQVLLFAGLQAFLLTLVWAPALAVPVLKTFALSIAVAVTLALAYLVGTWLQWTFGRERFQLDGSVLQHTVRVGPWSSRPVRIPLARILQVDGYDWLAEPTPGEGGPPPPLDRARLRVKTATDEHCFDLVGEWKLGAVADIIATLRPRLIDLGREVAGGGEVTAR